MGEEQYDYKLERVIRVKDGDTFIAVLSKDIGFHVTAQAAVTIRILDVDTYELTSKDPAWKVLAQNAKVFTGQWLMTYAGDVRVRTVEEDSFGRWLGHVYVPGGAVLADDLVDAGYEKPDSKWGPQ